MAELPVESRENLTWLKGEFSSQLANVFETMAGERPALTSEPLSAPLNEAGLIWKQPYAEVPGEIWLFASESDWSGAGQQVLRAAGIEDADGPTLKSTYLETVGQALSGVGQALTYRLGREVAAEAGTEADGPPADLNWIAVTLTFASVSILVLFGATSEFLNALGSTTESSAEAHENESLSSQPSATFAFGKSKTFELLLDVELPVSVSFGRAQVPLKDVLKLTTGSIVELNRSIVEPVEVIVNNCVIARGEVVVIEGNFGVRIQEVISRQERLRTLA